VSLTVDGALKTLAIDARTTLAERLDLHIGCGEGVCGACTVALDGVPVRACLILAAQADGCRVDTVKSLAKLEGAVPGADGLTPLQRRLCERHAFQCGYCVPGLLVGTACFLRGRDRIDSSEIATHLVGHICRCLASAGVAEAIEDVLEERRGARR
jgi:carbon-monoxide dehydrogenase small subunit